MEEEVHFGNPIGFSGRPETNNKYYKLYRRLKTKATNDELIELTNNESEILVVYAFNILHSRNYDRLKTIFFNMLGTGNGFGLPEVVPVLLKE